MKTTIISAAIAITAIAAASSALAAGAHDSYYQAFYGTHETASPSSMGDATLGAQSEALWNADAAYRQAFNSGGPTVMPSDTIGKAALGTPTGLDGNAIYHGAFRSD